MENELALHKINVLILKSLFSLWFISEFVVSHTPASQIFLLLFVGTTILMTFKMVKTSLPFWCYGLFFLFSLANIAMGYAVNNATALKMTITLGLNVVFIYALINYYSYCYGNNAIEFFRFYQKLVIGIAGLLLIFGLSNIMVGERLSTFGINANAIAMICSYALLVRINQVVVNKKIDWKDIAVTLLLMFAVLSAGSRKGLIIPFVGTMLIVMLRNPTKIAQYIVGGVIAGLIALYLIMNVDFLYSIIGYRVKPMIDLMMGKEYVESSMETRLHFIELAWKSSQDSLMMGHGLDCFRHLQQSYGTYSHNNFVEIIYSLGVGGFIVYYFPALLSFFTIIKEAIKARCDASFILASSIFFAVIVCDYFAISYFERTPLVLVIITTHCILEKKDEHKEIYQKPIQDFQRISH